MLKNMNLDLFRTFSLRDVRLLRILSSAIEAVDPFKAVQKYLPDLEGRVFGLGIGKAALPMMDALAARFQIADGLAVTKFALRDTPGVYTVIEGGHPIPDMRSLEAGRRVLEFVSVLKEEDTLVCLISGGGSALITMPYVPLEDFRTLTSLLLSAGAAIDEINILRRKLDRLKGGGLAHSTKAKIVSLILSDVIGNPIEAIASGPTAPDPTTANDALSIIKKYGIEQKVPRSILEFLKSESVRAETLPNASSLRRVRNIIIGDNKLAAQAAKNRAEQEGFHAEILTCDLRGEAREKGRELALLLRAETMTRARPFCLIAGGETTVTIKGNGKGGRNQEFALAAVDELAGLSDVMLIALATDGDDGPTDAAGAVVTGESSRRARSLGLDIAGHLSANDSYPFFDALHDLLKTGPTGTNVNDIVFLCGM